MVTKAQAMNAHHGQEFHFGECRRTIGKRGGIIDRIHRCRVSGVCKTWKTRPEEFYLPVKFGLYGNGSIAEYNAKLFHTAADCPILRGAE